MKNWNIGGSWIWRQIAGGKDLPSADAADAVVQVEENEGEATSTTATDAESTDNTADNVDNSVGSMVADSENKVNIPRRGRPRKQEAQ